MVIVIGYLAAVIVSLPVLWAVAGRDFRVEREPDVNLAEVAGRHVGILSGLAGFAITGMVLLVTLGRSLSDTSSTPYTTVVTMFFVSWMAFAACAFLFANIVDPKNAAGVEATDVFDVPAAQFVGAATMNILASGLGWFALRPLFQAFGLQRLSDLVAGILLPVVAVSYGLVAQQLRRAGYGPGRVLLAIPALSAAAVLVYVAITGAFGLRSDDATLSLIVAGFGFGAVAFLGVTTLTVSAGHASSARILARFGRYLVIGLTQAAFTFVCFLLVGVLGLA